MTAIVERRMQETLVHGSDWLAFIETQTHDVTANSGVAGASPQLLERERDPEAWAKTDRPLRMPLRRRSSAPFWNSPTNDEQSAVARWLKEHGVHTEFVDAGIGCCWFAYMGDDEPFCGETEEAALEKLARANGVELPVLQSQRGLLYIFRIGSFEPRIDSKNTNGEALKQGSVFDLPWTERKLTLRTENEKTAHWWRYGTVNLDSGGHL